MKQLKPGTRKILYGASLVLLLSVMATVGFLSFAGMLLVVPKIIGLAFAAFGFGGIVEGEVYIQNIYKGLIKLFSRDYLEQQLIAKKLAELATKENDSEFLRDYYAQRIYLEKLRANQANADLIKAAEKRLFAMQKYIFLQLKQARKSGKYPKELTDIIPLEEAKALNKEIQHKNFINFIIMPIFYIGAGISCGFASYYAATTGFYAAYAHFAATHAGLVTLMTVHHTAVLATSLLAGFAPLAVLAGIGYALILYRNVSDIIQDDHIQETWKKIKNVFAYKGENVHLYRLKVFAFGAILVALLALVTFATLATAGTWWPVAKAVTPYIIKVVNWIRKVSVVLMVIPALIFDFKQALATLENIASITKKAIREKWHVAWQEVKDAWQNESIPQFFNPFRFIANLLTGVATVVTLIAHCIATGMSSNKFLNVPNIPVAAVSGAVEGITDVASMVEGAGYVLAVASDNNQQPEQKTVYLIIEDNFITGYSVINLNNEKIQNQTFDKAIECPQGFNKDSPIFGLSPQEYAKLKAKIVETTSINGHTPIADEDEHEQGIVLKVVLALPLLILKFFSAVWARAFQRKEVAKGQPKTFSEHLFGIKPSEENEPVEMTVVSSSWKRQEVLMKFDKKIEHYKYKSKEKAATFSYLREQLSMYKVAEENAPSFKDWLKQKLKEKPAENISQDFVEDKKEKTSLINKEPSLFKSTDNRTYKEILGKNRHTFCNEKAAKETKALRFIEKLKDNNDYSLMLKN